MGSLRIAGVSSGGTVSGWVVAHEELTTLARRRSELDGLEGPALLRALRAGVHRHLGLGSFAEYVERLFGYSRRTLDDKLRTAEALEELPELTRSLREGVVSWSAVRELARVATPETEREWLEVARGRSVHEVERLVSGRRRGSRPADAPDAIDRRHALRFEVSAETFATFREAMAVLRRKSVEPLDDDSALLLMAREVLGGPVDEGKSSYQVALNICERCGRGSQDARGEVIPVDGAIVEMAECDAQHVGRVISQSSHVDAKGRTLGSDVSANGVAADTNVGANVRTVPPVGANGVTAETHVGALGRRLEPSASANGMADETRVGARGRTLVPTVSANGVADETHVGANGGTLGLDVSANDVATETHVGATTEIHVGANAVAVDPHVGESARATQTIPPALRRKVMRRDHGRCVVPGCRHATFVDLHHVEARADGGTNDEDNLIVLCSAHHRALHRGQLQITGRVHQGLTFRRSDGARYGALEASRSADICERAFRGLRGMGFGERDARRAVERARSSGDVEGVLRQALSLLTERVARCE